MSEPPTWEEVQKAEEVRRQIELEDARRGQEKALEKEMKGLERAGADADEIMEKQKTLQARAERNMEQLRREQQERLDRLELLYKGPPSEREKENEKDRQR